jgi:transcriptional regulator with XRE-family HTH domain
MIFGNIIREARNSKKLTVRELIRIMTIKVSPSYINAIERRGAIPSYKMILRLADALEIDQQHLLRVAKFIRMHSYNESISKEYKLNIE